MAYALSVLALALAPAPSLAAGLPGGTLLCSGAPVPDDGSSGAPTAPLGELAHCKGCPHNPVLAGPPVLATSVAMRTRTYVPLLPRWHEDRFSASVIGLPPSRAPPAA
jgi:hypothetical protein